MKVKELAANYRINQVTLENYLKNSQYKSLIKSGITGMTIDDNANFDEIVNAFRDYLNQINLQEAQAKQAEIDKQTAIANMLITSGFNFDGYHVVKYSGYISGDDAISVPRGWAIFSDSTAGATNVQEKLTNSLVVIRRNALKELKEAAYALGCNAVIGVDFDYITLDPQTSNITGGTTYLPYVFAVTANGNAVVIEKDDDYRGYN